MREREFFLSDLSSSVLYFLSVKINGQDGKQRGTKVNGAWCFTISIGNERRSGALSMKLGREKDGQRHYTTCSWPSLSVGGREYEKFPRVTSGKRTTVGEDRERGQRR